MKKWKRFAAVTAVMMLCLSLCGCQALEDMRAVHAVWQEDGSILWNGDVYRKLEGATDAIQPFYSMNSIRVTEADVPVLLSGMFGTSADVSRDGMLLCVMHWDGGYTTYCHEDHFDEINAYLQGDMAIDHYCYSYWSDEGELMYYYLTQEQQQVIDEILLSEEPLPSEWDGYANYEEGEYTLVIEGCDEKHLFTEWYMFEIAVEKDGYYLITEEHAYAVPPAYYGVFDEILKPYERSTMAKVV